MEDISLEKSQRDVSSSEGLGIFNFELRPAEKELIGRKT